MAGVVESGPRAIFFVNGEKVAYASGVNYNENQPRTPADVLDQLEPAELVPTGYTVDFSCTTFRVFDKSPKKIGIQPKLQDILTAPSLTAEIQSRVAGKTLALFERAEFVGRSGNFNARGLWEETWNFQCIKMSDEAGA